MIIQENLGNGIVRSYSNLGVYIHGGFPEGDYAVVYDPEDAGRTYTETNIPVEQPLGNRELSKRKLMNKLKEVELWDQVKTFLVANDFWDDWETSTTLEENDPFMKSAVAVLRNLLGLSEVQIEEIIAASAITRETV